MLNGILQIPKIPMGNPKIPILLLNGQGEKTVQPIFSGGTDAAGLVL